MIRVTCASLLTVLISLSAPPGFAAEAYPDKPIRLIVPFGAGGATDVLARALAEKYPEFLGNNVIVDNRGGAGGTVGTAVVARAAADGYTLLFTSPSYTFTPSIYKNLPYDALKDFKPVTIFARFPQFLLVHPALPVKNVKQLIALARSRPDEINFSSSGSGSNIHLTTALFMNMANIKLAHVPYKGGGAAMIALMSGEVQVLMASLNSALPFVKSGRMRALAVTTKVRTPAAPDLPTINESGVPGYDMPYWAGLFAPSAVPDAIVSRLYEASVKVLKNPDIAKRLAAEGALAAVGEPPSEVDAFVRAEIATWAKLIREMKLAQ